jgi:hypothetical protein
MASIPMQSITLPASFVILQGCNGDGMANSLDVLPDIFNWGDASGSSLSHHEDIERRGDDVVRKIRGLGSSLASVHEVDEGENFSELIKNAGVTVVFCEARIVAAVWTAVWKLLGFLFVLSMHHFGATIPYVLQISLFHCACLLFTVLYSRNSMQSNCNQSSNKDLHTSCVLRARFYVLLPPLNAQHE